MKEGLHKNHEIMELEDLFAQWFTAKGNLMETNNINEKKYQKLMDL
jgi:hypothetical protein